jgi:hypothetical protein
MKPPTRAPFFACLYPGLCDVARKCGYALAIHGTVTTDLDLVAIPWVPEALPADVLMNALMSHLSACGYEDLLRQDLPEELVRQIMARKEPGTDLGGTLKPHGRIAWNLYLQAGSKVDLSVMPRSINATPPER